MNKIREFFIALWKKPHTKNILLIALFGFVFYSVNIGRGVHLGSDTVFHAQRFAGTIRAFQDGQFIPQVDPIIFDGMGYAPNLFYGPLTSYIAIFLRILTPGWNTAINLNIILTMIAAGIAMYFLMKKIGDSKTVGLASAIAYMGIPYNFLNATRRYGVGDSLALVFAPLLFLSIYKIIHGEKGWILFGISVAGLLLSHNLSAMMLIGFAFLFMLPYIKKLLKWDKIKQFATGSLLALGLSAFFLIPFIEARFIGNYNVFISGFMSTGTFEMSRAVPSLGHFIAFTPININHLYHWIGLLSICTIILLPLTFKQFAQSHKKFVITGLTLTGISLIMQAQLFPWDRLPDSLAMIQFPWRLSVIHAFFISCISGLTFHSFFKHRHKNKYNNAKIYAIACVSGLTVITIALTGSNWVGARTDIHSRAESWASRHVMPGKSEYLPNSVKNYANIAVPPMPDDGRPWVWNGYDFDIIRPITPIALSGSMTFSDFEKDGTRMNLHATVEADGILELPTIFYPGYQATVNQNRVKTFESENGFAAIELPEAGEFEVRVWYGMSTGTKVGAGITGLSVLGLSIYGLAIYRRKV